MCRAGLPVTVKEIAALSRYFTSTMNVNVALTTSLKKNVIYQQDTIVAREWQRTVIRFQL
jgi:hypothetical protein